MILDLSNQNIRKIEPLNQYVDESSIDKIENVVFDNNSINKLEHLETYSQIKQFSLSNNSLVEIRGIVKLQNIQYLNLLNNSIIHIDALKDLKNLVWLNISGNEIKSLAPLKNIHYLKHIDASDNSISELSDLSALNELNTLNLNGNLITTLKSAQNYLPKNIKYLLIANNAIEDLNEICYLSSFNQLEALEFQNNPCVEHKFNEIIIDFRSFILNWCVSLNYLDGTQVTKKESLKAEWLYSQGKGRHFRPGQNSLLLEYLSKYCTIYPNESVNDEIRLSKILEKQQNYMSSSNSNSVSILQQMTNQSNLISISNNNNNNNRQNTNNLHLSSTISNISNDRSQSNNNKQYFLGNNNNNNTSFEDSDVELLNSETDFIPLANNNNNNTKSSNMREKFEFDFDNFKKSDLYNLKQNRLSTNQNPYEDYDKRPIKPLNENLFQKQLQEYTELSEDEINKIKQKAALNLHNRSKTVENEKIKSLKTIKQQQQTQQNQTNNNINKLNYIKKRSKTSNDIKIPITNIIKQQNQVLKSGSASSTSTIHYASDSNNSPRSTDKLQNQNLTNKTNKNVFTLKTNQNLKRPIQQPKLQNKQIQEFKTTQLKKLNLHEDKLKSIESQSSFNDRCATKIQAAWRGYYIRNCSVEIRKKFELLKYKRVIDYLKYLRENLNDLIDEHKQFCELNFEAFNSLWAQLNKIQSNNINMKQPILNKIDAEIKNNDENINNNLSSKILLKENHELKEKIRLLEEQCKEFEKKLTEKSTDKNLQFNDLLVNSQKSITNTQITQTSPELKNIHSEIITSTNVNTTSSNYDKTSTISNNESKLITSSSLSSTNIQPPLRVRLQKVNEKSVALKWDHNQLNADNKINGYRIYINNIMRGTVKSTDLKALINGIQEEGEYKITVRAFNDITESSDSNTVITRVKKLNKSQPQQNDNLLNKSDISNQSQAISTLSDNKQPIETTSSTTTATTTATTTTMGSLQSALIIPKIMDKIKANSQNSTLNNTTGSTTTSSTNHQSSTQSEKSPKKDKIPHSILKERLLEKQIQQQNKHQQQQMDEEFHELSSKLSKYAFLNVVDDKSRSTSYSPEEHSNEVSTQLPFSNSTNLQQYRIIKPKSMTQPISIKTKDLNNLIDYKPPISPSTPPRIPSPTHFSSLVSPVKINNYVSNTINSNSTSSKTSIASTGFEVNNSQNNKSSGVSLLPVQVSVSKHKQSRSVDLSFNINKLKQQLDKKDDDEQIISNNSTSTVNTLDTICNNNTLKSNNYLSTTNNISENNKSQKNFMIKSAKFSISEPNLSSSITKSDTSGGNGDINPSNKLDFVRQSVSFDDEDDDSENKNKENIVFNNNEENNQNLINVNRAQRIFRIRNKLLDEHINKANKNIIETS